MTTPTYLLVPILVLACGGPLAAQKMGEVPREAPSSRAPRGETLEATSAEGQPYWYRLPKKMSESSPANLIIMLHGTGMKWPWAFWNYGIDSGQFRKDDIVIAPEGMTPGQGDTFNFIQGKKDGDQLADLIRLFRRQFPIDKVYVYGHSQGAFFTYWFGGAYTELVDGIVAHAGNVLDVNHSKLAKEKLAVAILHGRADAVVTVECAYRTEGIYREQGYRNLKLEIVEGLTEQSGHWPLPQHVSALMDWLDLVCTDSPSRSIQSALSEITKEHPDVEVIARATAKARDLLRKWKGERKDELETRLAALTELVSSAAAAHVDAILATAEGTEKEDYAPWMAHFRRVRGAFADSSDFSTRLRKPIADAKRQDKSIANALRALTARAAKKSVASAVKSLESGPLAVDYALLDGSIARAMESLGDKVDEKTRSRYAALAARRGLDASAEEALRVITEKLTRAFREAHPTWFE